MGAPSFNWTPEAEEEIFNRMISGEGIVQICAPGRDDFLPSERTFYKRLTEDETFAQRYARAREAQADKMAEDILQIADDGSNDTYEDEDGNPRTDHDVVARSRLRVDARKWLASKMAPKKYGDKVAIGGADDLPPVDVTVGLRPQLTKEEWMAAHGVGTAIGAAK